MNHNITANLVSPDVVDDLTNRVALLDSNALPPELSVRIMTVLRSYVVLHEKALAAGNSAIILQRVVAGLLVQGEKDGKAPRLRIPATAISLVEERMRSCRPEYRSVTDEDGSQLITLDWVPKASIAPAPEASIAPAPEESPTSTQDGR